jgi:hypothetical protein
LREIFAVEPLHRQEALSVSGAAVRDVRDDAGVPELGEELGLAREALLLAAVSRLTVQELESDALAGELVARAEDRAHSACAGGVLDLEAIRENVPRAQLHDPPPFTPAARCRVILELEYRRHPGAWSEIVGEAPTRDRLRLRVVHA